MSALSHEAVQTDDLTLLLDASKNGDLEALGELFDSCGSRLHRAARQRISSDLRSRLDESDLVQQTFLDAHRSFSNFRGTTIGELQTWLRRILLNNLVNEQRRKSVTDYRTATNETFADLENLDARELDRARADSEYGSDAEQDQFLLLTRAMSQLSDPHLAVILWRTFAQLSFEEVGRRMDRTADATRMLWSRAIEELRSSLLPLCSE